MAVSHVVYGRHAGLIFPLRTSVPALLVLPPQQLAGALCTSLALPDDQ